MSGKKSPSGLVAGRERHDDVRPLNVDGPFIWNWVHFAPPLIIGTVLLSSARDTLVARARTVVSMFASVMNPLVAAGGFAR
jgi:hypothetical protein